MISHEELEELSQLTDCGYMPEMARELLALRKGREIPDGWKLVPVALSAENGAKAALIGEFNVECNLECHECLGGGCDDCDGKGRWISSIPVSWTTIKEIWAKGIEHFSPGAPGGQDD